MVTLYLLFAFISLVVFAFTPRLGLRTRFLIALLTFVATSAGMTVWVIVIGDKAPPDAVTVDLNEGIR